MQEPKNAPWGKENDLTRTQYVSKIKAIDAGTQYEPPLGGKPQTTTHKQSKLIQTATASEDIVFHDFDYVGYEVNDLNRSYNPEMNSIGVGREERG